MHTDWFQQQDTLQQVRPSAQPVTEPVEGTTSEASLEEETTVAVPQEKPERTRHTYQELQQLPPDATPAQLDSAIQSVFRPEVKSLATPQDTLLLSTKDSVQEATDINFSKYYKEGFFTNNALLHPELNVERYGVAGDPVPYSIQNDDVITGLLLGCFLLMVFSFSRLHHFILQQAKSFFHIQRSENVTVSTETSDEFRFQFFMVALTCLLWALLAFFYTQANVADTFILQSQYQLIAIFFGCFSVYFLLKGILYPVLNSLFFNRKKNEQWMKSMLYLSAMEGVVLFPIVMLQSYFGISVQSAIIYAAVVLILVKLLTIYKCFVIFFRQNGAILQIILYFCALEIVPMLALAGFLVMIVDYLKINF
ncbi:MAG: DUF4271 domain-containing protein [Prevotella sp.]|nr:DUF4271 domain-containing protein [Prevotella sp.]